MEPFLSPQLQPQLYVQPIQQANFTPAANVSARFTPRIRGFMYAIAFLAVTTSGCRSGPYMRWRADGRCGVNFPLADGSISECNPESDRPCCSDYGYCGNSPSHCRCAACIDYRDILREPTCTFVYKGETGVLESPHFPKPYLPSRECCYNILRPSPEYCGVQLTVLSLDVGRPEEGGFCQRDWVSMPSCAPERGTRICGNTTGQVYEYLFQPNATAIRLVFHAGDLTEGRTGFRIRYDLLKTCFGPYQTQNPPVSSIPGTGGAGCYTRITDTRGTINTPYHPKKYPNGLDCVYEFVRSSPEVCGIRMQSTSFELESPIMTYHGGACLDFLHLPSCGFLCGKLDFTLMAEYQPGATSLKFHFHSDEKTGHAGFLVRFEQTKTC